jgi:hypothetical protein
MLGFLVLSEGLSMFNEFILVDRLMAGQFDRKPRRFEL